MRCNPGAHGLMKPLQAVKVLMKRAKVDLEDASHVLEDLRWSDKSIVVLPALGPQRIDMFPWGSPGPPLGSPGVGRGPRAGRGACVKHLHFTTTVDTTITQRLSDPNRHAHAHLSMS